MRELGITQDVGEMYWHDLRLFGIIEREWKSLEQAELKRQSRKKR